MRSQTHRRPAGPSAPAASACGIIHVELLRECSYQPWQIAMPEPHFAANETFVIDLSQREQWDLFWVASIPLFEVEPGHRGPMWGPLSQQLPYDPPIGSRREA